MPRGAGIVLLPGMSVPLQLDSSFQCSFAALLLDQPAPYTRLLVVVRPGLAADTEQSRTKQYRTEQSGSLAAATEQHRTEWNRTSWLASCRHGIAQTDQNRAEQSRADWPYTQLLVVVRLGCKHRHKEAWLRKALVLQNNPGKKMYEKKPGSKGVGWRLQCLDEQATPGQQLPSCPTLGGLSCLSTVQVWLNKHLRPGGLPVGLGFRVWACWAAWLDRIMIFGTAVVPTPLSWTCGSWLTEGRGWFCLLVSASSGCCRPAWTALQACWAAWAAWPVNIHLPSPWTICLNCYGSKSHLHCDHRGCQTWVISGVPKLGDNWFS